MKTRFFSFLKIGHTGGEKSSGGNVRFRSPCSQLAVGRRDRRLRRRRRRTFAEKRRIVFRVEKDDLDHSHDDGEYRDLKCTKAVSSTGFEP